MCKKLGYMAIDERYGETIHLKTMNPRKELLEKVGATVARKMYADEKDGSIHHIGYVIKGHWFRVYEVHEWGKLVRSQESTDNITKD